MKSKIIALFSLAIILTALFAGSFPVKADAFAECSPQNPEGTMVCAGLKRYVAGSCQTEADAAPLFSDCAQKFRVFSCASGCTGTCINTNKINCGGTCITPFSQPDPTCASQNRTFDPCTGQCGSCLAGFESVFGQCMTLQMVEGRVTTLEGVAVCAFNAQGDYVDPQGNSCEFDSSTLDGRLTITETGTRVLMQIMANLLGLNALTGDTVESYLKGLVQQLCVLDPTLDCGVADWNTVTAGELLGLANNLMTAVVAKFNTLIDQRISDAIAGTRTQFVGLSANAIDGDLNGTDKGYKNANNECANKNFGTVDGRVVGTGSHICSAQELINSYVRDIGALNTASGLAWLNNGPPGYIQNLSNDCDGWHSISSGRFGSIWKFQANNEMSGVMDCSNPNKFACCK